MTNEAHVKYFCCQKQQNPSLTLTSLNLTVSKIIVINCKKSGFFFFCRSVNLPLIFVLAENENKTGEGYIIMEVIHVSKGDNVG